MKKTIWLLAAGLAASSLFASTSSEICRLESGGPLAADPAEAVVIAPKDMKLILCIGQSNMAGRGKMTDEDRAVVPNAYKLNRDGQWVAAKSPYHFDRANAGVGPIDGFVKLYLRDHPGETVGVVPCAVGGSAMKTWDCTRSGKCGANLRQALARAHVAASNGTFIAVLWHQGETDAAKSDAESLMKSYPGRVKAMMEHIRSELGVPDLPLIVGEIGRWVRKDGDHAARINPAIGAIPAMLPHAALASSEGLVNQDAHHFDRAGQFKLAERYYSAWEGLSAVRPSTSNRQTSLPFVAKWRGNRAAAVSFTFDDGLRDQYELAFPKMKALGLKGTFFLNGGLIESQKPTKQGALRMTWEMVREMSDAGMEMSNHGLNHLNHGRTPRDAIEVDIASNDVLIARHTGKKPITYAYPNNAKNKEWSASVVNPGRVGARTRQASFGGKHTVESGRKLFKKAKSECSWLVLMTHAVKHGYDQWRDPDSFYTLLADASQDKDLWVATFAEVSVYERLRNETKVTATKTEKGWQVVVTPPPLDQKLFAGTLDLVLPDGTIRSFDPFGGDFVIGRSVRYRGIFINDEDWSLRPWAVRHFGKREQIGTNAYREVFRLMKEDGLNLLWPAMHEGGYEFSSRPENLALAKEFGIAIGTSHCEPMLRNNCYIPKADHGLWSWTKHRNFIEDYWREGVRRGGDNEILWTIGMRGIHDGGMKDGKTTKEKIAVLEDVFAFQKSILPTNAPTLFCPYKEVLPLYNAGLKVPDGATVMWVNDNFGYVRRIGGNDAPQGIYWHLSYHGYPHGYIHLCTTPPAFMWYELVAKCWENGVRDVWMVNAGDVFQAELLLDSYGRMANAPDAWGADAQDKLLAQFVGDKLKVKSEKLRSRIVAHLNDYCNLGFIRKPEHMCIQWTTNLPSTVRGELLARYGKLLAEDLAIEEALSEFSGFGLKEQGTRNPNQEAYFRAIGFSVQFLAHAGIVHLTGKDKDYAYSVLKPLYARWDEMEGGKWSGFWCDTVDERGGKRQKATANRWSTQMQWAWNEPAANKTYHGAPRRDYPATAYRADIPEPTWLEPAANAPARDGGWVRVKGLGTSDHALALLPVKPGKGIGATLAYQLPTSDRPQPTLVLQFLPDYALWPGLKLGVNVRFDGGEPQYVAVPKSNSNLGEKDVVRNQAVQDNFIRVTVPMPPGAHKLEIVATDPGVVIDRVGVR